MNYELWVDLFAKSFSKARVKVSYKWVLPCAGFVVSFFGRISVLISCSKHLWHVLLDHNCMHNKIILVISFLDLFVLLPIKTKTISVV